MELSLYRYFILSASNIYMYIDLAMVSFFLSNLLHVLAISFSFLTFELHHENVVVSPKGLSFLSLTGFSPFYCDMQLIF